MSCFIAERSLLHKISEVIFMSVVKGLWDHPPNL